MHNPTEAFEAHFAREIVESERLRMAILAALFALLALLMPVFAWVFRADYEKIHDSWLPLELAFGTTVALVAYELAARWVHGRFLRRGVAPPASLRFWNAFVETSVPSLLIYALAQQMEPNAVLHGPAGLLYAVFIVLATLRLDFWLCAFTGLVAGLEFGALGWWFTGGGRFAEGYSHLSNPAPILMKALVLLFAGVVAGLVARQLRRRIAKAFYALRERERVLSAFGQQVSPAVAEELLRQGRDAPGRKSFVCVMFMDIRDFTRQMEHRAPEEIVAYQNRVFGAAVDIVNRHHGVINQFLGDGFMATFGAPLATGDDCRNAVAAARELVARLDTRIGVGLHAGDAVSGNVGSEERKQYSITGNVVILASRIEQLNKDYGSQLLVSREVLERAGDQAAGAQPLGPVRVKGRDEPIEIYRLA